MKRKKLLLGLAMLIPISFMKVEAKIFTINEVSEYLNKGSFNTKVNSTNKTLDFYSDGDAIFAVQYTDDYLLYDDPVTSVTQDKVGMAMISAMYFPEIIKSMMAMSGVTVDSLKEKIFTCTDYDKYGLAIKSLKYNFSDSENGSSASIGGEYINYLKLTLDSDKLVNLANTYGIVVDKTKYKDLVPSINMKISRDTIDETKKKVNYRFGLNYTPTDENDNPMCIMYRSDSLNGTYSQVQSQYSCMMASDGVMLIDRNVEKDKAYYYKAQVVGSDKFSDIIKVDLSNDSITDPISGEVIKDNTASKDNEVNDKTDGKTDDKTTTNDKKEEPKKDYKNPETGDFLPLLPILILILASIGVWHKVKDKFVRI